jgi:DNA-binding transcriptional LysR family regulator
MHPPDPDLLHTFIAIVDNGSFSSAAKRIHRTQSAVSMQVRRLEEAVGCQLFERLGRSVRLTNEGEVFFDHARRIVRAYREALSAFGSVSLEGEVTIGAPDDYAASFLPGILSRFSRLHPNVHIHLVCEPSKRLVAQVNEGSIDVALVTEGEAATSGIVVHRERLVWVSSEAHRIHDEDPVPLAIFHTGDVFRRYAIEQLQALGRRARIKVTSPSFAGICAAVDAGIAVAALFRSNLRPGWRVLGLLDGYPELPELGIVLQRSSQDPSEVVDRLAEHVLASFRTPPAGGAG